MATIISRILPFVMEVEFISFREFKKWIVSFILSSIDYIFYQIEKRFHFLPTKKLKNKLVSLLIRLLIYAIKIAESNGWNKKNIRAKLPNAWRIHRKSIFIKHIQDWPRGYPGDFEIINMIVDRTNHTNYSSLGTIIGNYAVHSKIAEQHRNKLHFQAQVIKDVCSKFKNPNIVSIACGSSRDIEVVQQEIKKAEAKIILVDFDQDALDESMRRLVGIQHQIDTVLTDVRRLPILLSRLAEKNGKFHLIYAGGLFDYLPPGIIKIILKNLSKNFIHKNGIIMFTNISAGNPYRPWIETMGNWKLIERSKKEMEDLLAITKYEKKVLELDPTSLSWIAKAYNIGKIVG